MKGNFGLAVKSLTSTAVWEKPLMPDVYRGGNEWFFTGPDGIEHIFSYSGHNSSLTAFRKCPPLTNIITRKAQAYVNGKTWVMNTQGKESGTPQAKNLRKLFSRPNPLQSWRQFEAQQYIYEQLFGFSIVLPIIPAGFKDPVDATGMWNIPPFLLEIEESDNLWYQTTLAGIIKSITLNYKGRRSPLDISKLWIFKDFVPSMVSMVFPESRVCALEMPINNIIGAFESRNELINYRGAKGILSSEGKDAIGSIPLKEPEKEQIYEDFKRYGLRKSQRQVIITSAALRWQQIGHPTKDLMLFEEIEDDTMQICDAYGYPYRLLSQEKSASYNDVKEFKKLLYQDTIMSEADSNYEQWNQLFRTDEHNIILQKDYSHLPTLQEDAQKKATARKTLGEELRAEFYANTITYNRMLELLEEDTRPDFNKYYYELVAEGMTFTLPQVQQNENTSTGSNTSQ